MGRYSTRDTTSSYRQLDIRVLKRKGFLQAYGWQSLNWSRNGEAYGSIRMRVEFDRVVLSYRHQRYGDDWQSEEYPVFLESTPCNYGGTRLWFLCPGRGCSRRVAVLYGGSIFACRHCHQLSYESQRETSYGRALSRAQAIKVKLGGSPGGDFPDKPKRMHWHTYERLWAEFEAAENQSWPPFLLRALGDFRP